MSPSIRFLGIAIFCWAGVRAISLGLLPGPSWMAFDAETAKRTASRLPAVQPSLLPAIEPVQAPGQSVQPALGPMTGYPPFRYAAYQPYPIYVPVPMSGQARSVPPQLIYVAAPSLPGEVHVHSQAMPGPTEPQKVAIGASPPSVQVTPTFAQQSPSIRFDRLSVSSWALMRDTAGPDSLANSGMLGGSEAGARLMWKFDPRLAATLRTSAPINSQRGMEAALGLRYQPFATWPVAVTLERRRRFRDYGRDAFAILAEGGIYGLPAPWQSALEGYFQAGIVDFNNPDWFVDGQAAVSRPVWRNVSAGFGVWGGAQPGLSRLDAGPRMSLKVGKSMRAHLDYRLNVAGNAQPGSGATVTLAGDF